MRERREVHRLKLDVHAKPFHQVGANASARRQEGDVSRIEHNDFFALVAGRKDRFLRFFERFWRGWHLDDPRKAATEHGMAEVIQLRIVADDGLHKILLIDGIAQRAAQSHVIEWRVLKIEVEQGRNSVDYPGDKLGI